MVIFGYSEIDSLWLCLVVLRLIHYGYVWSSFTVIMFGYIHTVHNTFTMVIFVYTTMVACG